MSINSTHSRRNHVHFGWAWVGLTFALALHVTDEALTNFLSVYNPTVLAIRRRFPFLLIPTFTFKVWLSGLIMGIALLLILSPLAFRGVKWLIVPAYVLSVMMIGNGLQHIVASVYMGRLMPGVYSSPILLLSAIYLFGSVRHRDVLWASHVEPQAPSID